MEVGDEMRLETVIERLVRATGKISETFLCIFKSRYHYLEGNPACETYNRNWQVSFERLYCKKTTTKNPHFLNEAQESRKRPPGWTTAKGEGRVSCAAWSMLRHLSRALCKSNQLQNQITII